MNRKKKLIELYSMLSLCLILNGCSRPHYNSIYLNENENTEYTTNDSYDDYNNNLKEKNKKKKIKKKKLKNKSIDPISNNKFDNFNSETLDIKRYINKQNYDKAKKKGKEYIVNAIDFIFFDKEVKGVKFNDLTNKAKIETYRNLQKMDQLIMEFEPNYKEDLSSKYNKVKDYSILKYDSAKEKIKDKIGNEKYNEITDKKNTIKKKSKRTLKKFKKKSKKVKKKVINWYKDWKEKAS